MDYAFAPGSEPRLKMLQQLLRDRTDGGALDTTLVTGPTTVAEFLSDVEFDASKPKPTGDLLLGSHGNDTGWLQIDLDSAADREVSYAVVKEAYANTGRRVSLRIPPDFYTAPSGQVPIRVLIRGCRVGQAPKFVDALKLLFGGQVPIVAPKHFFALAPAVKTRRKKIVGRIGLFEHLSYSNQLISRDELTRDKLVDAYRSKGFPQFDSTTANPNPIPDLWDKWIPPKKGIGVGKPRPFSYRVSLGRTIDGLPTLSDNMGEFRHRTFKVVEPIANPPAAEKTEAGFKQKYATQPKFQANWGSPPLPTGFPLHEQLGHKTFDDFFASFKWTRPKKDDADPFTWIGVRHEYNVVLPVVEPPMVGKDEKLIYNFFPPRGSGGTAFIELLESDGRLFYTTP